MASTGLVADSGKLWVGATTAAAPTTVSGALTGFTDVGRLAKNGIALTSTPTIVELTSFGELDPTRTRKTREIKQFTARLQAWNTASYTLAFNGGTVVVAAGVATYTPVDDTTLVQHSIVWEFEDGTNIYRLYLPLVEVRSGISMDFSDENYTEIPLDVTVLKPVGGSTYKLITNDAAFVASP